ncbi:amphi-Trp domain-containing protein [Marinibacterium profundimaris]|uniref:Amphi-Trp domain-containing protein n=1 Tax=Marinibacterium profundimaris TaxID=1679460 RepID=A0A225NLR2_9RHOB|nr:amphi-Trp domain-containing protein [Marinibacterium profundimaris]OWU75007.1 hypothetical protein ATO3_10735 [Marinibacterium profundimaris]
MSNDTSRFIHDSLQDAKTIKSLLTALSKGLSKGEMTLSDGDKELVLQTAKLISVRIKAERENGQCEVSLNLSWADPKDHAPRSNTPTITS